MNAQKNTIVVTDSNHLSEAADAIISHLGDKAIPKNTILNLLATSICGPKINWGGLKAKNNPVYSSGLSFASLQTSGALTTDPECDPDHKVNTKFKNFTFSKKLNGILVNLTEIGDDNILKEFQQRLHFWEVPMLLEALFSGDSISVFDSENFNFRRVKDKIYTKPRTSPSEDDYIPLFAEDFKNFLDKNHGKILEGIIGDGVGKSIATAFEMVMKTQGKDIFYESASMLPEPIEYAIHGADDESNYSRIEAGPSTATWMFLATAIKDPVLRRNLLNEERQSIVDIIFENAWMLLYDAYKHNIKTEFAHLNKRPSH